MKNLHTKLEGYAKQWSEILLNEHLKALVDEAVSNIQTVEAEDLYTIGENLILIDVREPEEFSSGYINAHNVLTISRGKLEIMALNKIAKEYGQDAPIITYCLRGPRGALAAYQLKKLGFTNVKNLNGGITSWLEKGNTIYTYLGEMALR
mgnify:CR=1 FL=1